jgi:hypothetical protein
MPPLARQDCSCYVLPMTPARNPPSAMTRAPAKAGRTTAPAAPDGTVAEAGEGTPHPFHLVRMHEIPPATPRKRGRPRTRPPKPPGRRRGAQLGNRNRLRHGRYSAAYTRALHAELAAYDFVIEQALAWHACEQRPALPPPATAPHRPRRVMSPATAAPYRAPPAPPRSAAARICAGPRDPPRRRTRHRSRTAPPAHAPPSALR